MHCSQDRHNKDLHHKDLHHKARHSKYLQRRFLRCHVTPVRSYFRPRSAVAPAYFACEPNSSSMRISWLYFAVRSERESEPVLIWPQFVATARSAIVVSSVSPERCDMTAL